MKRTDVLNRLISELGFTSYLEIGTQQAENIIKINADIKIGVDIQPAQKKGYTHIEKSSNEFFETNKDKFDLIFIDGDHSHEQSLKDFENALKCLNKGGLICLHDTNPYSMKYMQLDWSGEVYKTALEIFNRGFQAVTVEQDHGVTIVAPSLDRYDSKQVDVNMNQMEFLNQKQDLLNFTDLDDLPFESFKKTDDNIKKASNQVDREYLEKLDDDDLKKVYKETLGTHVRKFSREKAIDKILNYEA